MSDISTLIQVMNYLILGVISAAGAILAYVFYDKEVLYPKRLDLWKARRGVLIRVDESAALIDKKGTEKEIKELKLKGEKCRMPLPEDVEWGLKKGALNRFKDHLIVYSPYPGDYRVIKAVKDLESFEFQPVKTNMKLFYIQDIKQNRLLTKRQSIGDLINRVIQVAAPLILAIAIVIVWKQGAEFMTQLGSMMQGVSDTLLKSTEMLSNIQQLVPAPPA